MDPQRRVLENTSVAVRGETILEIGPADELRRKYTAKKTLNARRRVVMPGLVDLHAHAGCALHQVGRRALSRAELAQHPRLHLLSLLARLVVPRLAVLQPREDEVRHHHEPLHARLRAALGQSRIRLRQRRRRREGRHPLGDRRRARRVRPIRATTPTGRTGGASTGRSDFEESIDKMEETIALWKRKNHPTVDIWVLHLAPAQREPQRSGLRSGQRQVHPAAGRRARARDARLRRRLPLPRLRHGGEVPQGERARACSGRRPFWATAGRSTWSRSRSWPRPIPASAHCPRAQRVYLHAGRLPVPEMIDAGVAGRPRLRFLRARSQLEHVGGHLPVAAHPPPAEERPDPDAGRQGAGDGDHRRRQGARARPPHRLARDRQGCRHHPDQHVEAAHRAAVRPDDDAAARLFRAWRGRRDRDGAGPAS